MRASTVLALAAASTLALAACQKKTEQAPAPAETPAAAPAATPAAPSLKRRAGLWEIRISSGDTKGTPAVSRFCTDAAVEAQVSILGAEATKDMCSRSEATHRPDGSWAIESTCDMGTGGVVTSKGVVTGDLNSHYQIKSTSVRAGASVPQMNRTDEAIIDASYMGACPADMKPGDMSMAGAKVNIIELTRRGK